MVPLVSALLAAFVAQQAPLREKPEREVDVLHYRIEIALEEATRSIDGEATLRMTSQREGLETVRLDAETFTVERVVDASGRELGFTQEGGKLVVALDAPAAYGDELSLTISYGGSDIDVDPERYGMAKGYDLGLDFKSASEDHPQLVNTLNFPEGARHWFPSQDHPSDRATAEVIATAREDYEVLSNGRLVSVSAPKAGKRTWHWSQELPHPTYLFVLVAGPYVVLEDAHGELPLHYWVYEKDVPDAMRSFEKTPEILAFFEEEYGTPFAWVKYDQITIPGIGGGAESTSATVLGESTIHDAAAEQDFPSHWLVAHEAAHQWWGNLVSYRDWSETWLSESFATFGEYLFSRHDLGEDEGAVNLLEKKNAYLREARERYMRPIVSERWRYPNDNFDRHTYQKGAVVLAMLRSLLGDAAFRGLMAHFLEKHAFQPVDTHDLVDAVEEATGRNLGWFFDQWIYRAGHPVLDVSYDWSAASKRLVVRVQQQTPEPYRLPIRIGVHTASARTSELFWVDSKDARIELAVAEKPLLVRFDEGNVLLKEWSFQKPEDELVYQLGNDDVIGRMWAASQLGEHPAVAEAARRDPFWAVRRSALEALDASATIELLKDSARDPDSRVRASALRLLGDRRMPQHVAFFQERFRLDDSYVARAEALRALGKTGDRSTRAFLEEAAAIDSPRDVLERAALEALEQLR